MTREAAVKIIKETLSEVMGWPVSEIDSSQGLENNGVDSIGMVEFLTALETKLKIDFSPEDFLGASSIEKLADTIVKKRSNT